MPAGGSRAWSGMGGRPDTCAAVRTLKGRCEEKRTAIHHAMTPCASVSTGRDTDHTQRPRHHLSLGEVCISDRLWGQKPHLLSHLHRRGRADDVTRCRGMGTERMSPELLDSTHLAAPQGERPRAEHPPAPPQRAQHGTSPRRAQRGTQGQLAPQSRQTWVCSQQAQGCDRRDHLLHLHPEAQLKLQFPSRTAPWPSSPNPAPARPPFQQSNKECTSEPELSFGAPGMDPGVL